MQRSEVGALLKHLEHLVGKDDALVELLASVHHTVTHGINFLQVFDDTYLRVGKQ